MSDNQKKHWIQKALKKPGSLSAAAKHAGESTEDFAREHDGDPGTLGKRARLAEVLMNLRKKS